MRGVAILATAAAIYSGAHDAAQAQTSAPTVVTPTPGLSTPVTSTTTNCMMSCNAQAANCQTGCFIPVPPAVTPAGTVTLNPTAITACVDLRLLLPQQLRQLGEVDRQPPRLVLGQQIGGRAPAGPLHKKSFVPTGGVRHLIDHRVERQTVQRITEGKRPARYSS